MPYYPGEKKDLHTIVDRIYNALVEISLFRMRTGIFHNGFIKFVPRWISVLSFLVIILLCIKVVTTVREFSTIININDYYVDKLHD